MVPQSMGGNGSWFSWYCAGRRLRRRAGSIVPAVGPVRCVATPRLLYLHDAEVIAAAMRQLVRPQGTLSQRVHAPLPALRLEDRHPAIGLNGVMREYYEARAVEYGDWWLGGKGLYAERQRPG